MEINDANELVGRDGIEPPTPGFSVTECLKSAINGSKPEMERAEGERMISPFAFATSLALLTAVLFLLFLVLDLVAPGVFKFLFNAQFFGADVAALLPQRASFGAVIGTFAALVISAWGLGYAWAWLYNQLRKYF